jgi:NADPH2:quinone reductase
MEVPMKAWLLEKFKGLGAMKLVEVPEPAAGEGEVVLEIERAGLNPADRYLSEGQYPAKPKLPHVLGRDGVGIVREGGKGVTSIKEGDRKVILRGPVGVERWGTFAQKVAVPVESLVDVPAGWNLDEAGGATLVYLTAYQALTQWGELPGAVVLVTGASGGVGVAVTQLAGVMGQTVVALSRSKEKGERLQEIGAAIVLDPEDREWVKKLKERLAGRRVDLAIDNIGGSLFNQVLETMGNNGRISVVGRLAGPVPEFNTASLFFRRLRIGGVAVGTYTNAEARAAWGEVVKLMAKGGKKPVVDEVFKFRELKEAFERLRRGPMGKVLLGNLTIDN